MKTMMAALIAAQLLCSEAMAGGDIHVGLGANRCHEFTVEPAEPDSLLRLSYITWVQGFLTGAGFIGEAAGLAPSLTKFKPANVVRSLDAFCKENPQESVVAAAMSIYLAAQDGTIIGPSSGRSVKPAPGSEPNVIGE